MDASLCGFVKSSHGVPCDRGIEGAVTWHLHCRYASIVWAYTI